MYLGSVIFNGFIVVLYLVECCWFIVVVNYFFILFVVWMGNDYFVGINFDGVLGDDDIIGKGNYVVLYIKRLLV